MTYEISITEGNVTLTVYTNSNWKTDLETPEDISTFLKIESTTDKEGYFADNALYFYNMDENRKAEIKKELKHLDQYYKGVIKDIKAVFKEARKQKLLPNDCSPINK